MAVRSARQPKRRGEKALARSARAAQDAAAAQQESAVQRLAALERECERLEVELAEAKARIAALEEQRKAVVNRIDWMIDSLHNLIESR